MKLRTTTYRRSCRPHARCHVTPVLPSYLHKQERERLVLADEGDPLAFARGLLFAVPLGILIWILLWILLAMGRALGG